jgi:eukaryotic-like serine/threonine-protein kinase
MDKQEHWAALESAVECRRRNESASFTAIGWFSATLRWLRAVVIGWFGPGGPVECPPQLGPYTLEVRLGAGAMGSVYKARHALLPRPAAVKLLNPKERSGEAVRRFEREAQLTSLLTHPNTISIYDFGRTPDGAFYYVMEYVDGVDLQTLVEREGPQPASRVAHLLAQVCASLAEAHAAGLIHRDVKPANIMLCERAGMSDVVKVLDFGLVTRIDEPRATTEADSVLGTPHYLAPEALTQDEPLDGRSDLYAVGGVGYFLLTGSPPFPGNSVVEVCARQLYTAPVAPSERRRSEVPACLERLILGCLQKSKRARPPSAAALRAALLPLARSWNPAQGGGAANQGLDAA